MLCLLKDICGYLLLAFPLILLFGLVPQANTLVSNVLEQVDMHVFGASGSVNLPSVVVSVGRSCMVIGLGFGFCYAAVVVSTNSFSDSDSLALAVPQEYFYGLL